MICHVSDLVSVLRTPMDSPAARTALAALFLHHADRASRRYPPCYFELGERDEHSVRSLSHTLLADCENVVRGRRPFGGQTPFRFYAANQVEDPAVLRHTFYERFSLLREVLKENFAENLKYDTSLRWQTELWTRVSEVLRRRAAPTGEVVVRHPVFQLSAAGIATEDPLERLVVAALEGGPRTQARVVDAIRPRAMSLIVQEALPAAPRGDEDHMDRLAVRRAVQRTWAAMDTETRAVVAAVVTRRDAEQVFARRPDLASAVDLTRFVARIDARFVEELVAEIGRAALPKPEALPRALLELIYEVLAELGEAEFPRKVWRDAWSTRAPPVVDLPLPAPAGPHTWEAAAATWSALHHPALAPAAGLGGSLLAQVGAVAWEADPARALAEAELDEGLWIDPDDEFGG